jgi:hypothetical protein
MAVELIATVRGGTLDQYDAASEKLIKGQLPPGLQHHVCVGIDDGFQVIETWDSEESVRRFTESERFREEIEATGMPAPDIQVLPVHYVEEAKG